MDRELYEELNAQVNRELFSAYLYLSMASFFDSIGLEGFATWMKVQAKEEFGHAMRIYDYLNDRGERVIFEKIEKPENNFKSVVDVFEKTLEHEKKITKNIEDLYSLAKEKNDYQSEVFLHWFINEQVEEEKQASRILEKLKKIEGKEHLILMFDKEMGKRGEEK
ncbi:MAG: ferritin [Candidatus Omnitrophica bacterium]|nr:ferritin [Candidatus Omnitrophota bacterium]MCM8801767.1 ferritin [Candidatus Omnitrophota bacterium]